MGEHLTAEVARHPACLIETLADREEAEEYAEGKVRQFVVLQRTMSAGRQEHDRHAHRQRGPAGDPKCARPWKCHLPG